MTPRQAQVALAGFILLSGGVVFNALYMQGEPGTARRAVTEPAARPPVDRARPAEVAPPAKTATKRTAQLKPDSAKADLMPEAPAEEASADTIKAIQRELGQHGFGPVASDGVMRPVTRAAIMAYEHDHRLPLTGEATEALLTRLVLGVPANTEVSGSREVRSPQAEALIKQVQRMLTANGYRPGPADGRMTADTASAIRAFEEDQGFAARGRVSAAVVGRLQESAVKLKAAEAR